MSDPAENVGFARSADGGATWSVFGSPVGDLLITGFDVSVGGETIYANERDSFVIRKLVDGEVTWQTTEINQANGPVAVSPADSDLVIYAGSSVIYRSKDGLESWGSVFDAGSTVMDTVFVTSDPTVVYAVTEGYLLYRSDDSGASFTLVSSLCEDALGN